MEKNKPASNVAEFAGIEAARGWLAWIVVMSHIVLLSGIAGLHPKAFVLILPGDWSVTVFIIISGFVITHLRLKRSEPYGLYIKRRALRIFPAYLVCLIIGIIVTYTCSASLSRLPWPSTPGSAEMFRDQYNAIRSLAVVYHVLAHVILAHGILPEQVLRGSSYMFLAPAWSLSLEWQFYLIAPFVVTVMRRSVGLVSMTLLTCMGSFAFSRGWFGLFWSPSFLPGAGIAFWFGIMTRLNVSRLPRFNTYPWYLIGLALAPLAFVRVLLPYITWGCLVAYFSTDRQAGGVYRPIRLILEHPVFYQLGLRSYSVYLLHWPIVMIVMTIATKALYLGPNGTLLFSFIATVPATLAASELLYRYVEVRGIALGRRIPQTTTPQIS